MAAQGGRRKLGCIFRALCVLLMVWSALCGVPVIEMSVKDASIGDLANLNLIGSIGRSFAGGFSAGIKYSYNSLRNAPEKIFVRKRSETNVADVDVRAEFDVGAKVVAVDVTVKRGADALRAELDSENKLTLVELKKTIGAVFGRKLILKPRYNLKSKRVSALAYYALDADDTTLEVEHHAGNTLFRVCHKLDEDNTIIPQINIKNGEMKYSWIRKLERGSALTATLHPGHDLQLKLVDPGVWGVWTATAKVPLDDSSKSTVTFKRTWEF